MHAKLNTRIISYPCVFSALKTVQMKTDEEMWPSTCFAAPDVKFDFSATCLEIDRPGL
jgi:hypothetical protein